MTEVRSIAPEYASTLPKHFPDNSRVWVYLADRPFSGPEKERLQPVLTQFAANWKSHGHPVPAWAGVLLDQFIVLVADASEVGMGGCSIDASVQLLKQIEAELGVQLFERMRFAWWDGQRVRTAMRDEFARLYAEGVLDDETAVFDPLVQDLGSLRAAFVKPLGESWHRRMV